MKRIITMLMGLFLSACTQKYLVSDNLDYAYNLPPLGSTLVLKQPITIPAGEVRVFLQHGEVFSKSDFDRYEPSCSLELRTLADQPREIHPDSFIVSTVQRLMQQVVRSDRRQSAMLKVDYENGGKPMVVHGYHLWLGSEEQPDVMRMTCRGYFDDISRSEPPSLNDVTKSLGEFAELILAI
ncbi:MAG: hypothetical protein PVI92_02500 [Chromatiales bacterium]|jgi:hypothetical protein